MHKRDDVSHDRLILDFYSGVGPDDRGRFLHEILRWSDTDLERLHDYIQWLFPLSERSGFNPSAPLLDEYTIRQFNARADLQASMRASLRRMLSFYGLQMLETDRPRVVRDASFVERSENWVLYSNHNHLRLTRILKSLRLLGLEAEAIALFDCLADIYRIETEKPVPGISEQTFCFWQIAAAGSAFESKC